MVLVGVHICHNIGTHLGNMLIVMVGNKFCSNICSGGSIFWGSKLCVTDLIDANTEDTGLWKRSAW